MTTRRVSIRSLAVLFILAGCAEGESVRRRQKDSDLSYVGREMAMELDKAVQVFFILHNRYPTTDEGLDVLRRPISDGKPLLARIPNDPWDRPWVYLQPGRRNPNRFDIISTGSDAKLHTDDDVGNW